jgi:selenoprotein W-related protein
MAQELLTTFEKEIGEIALVPGTGGVLDIRVNEEIIFSRKKQGVFPELNELKQLILVTVSPQINPRDTVDRQFKHIYFNGVLLRGHIY